MHRSRHLALSGATRPRHPRASSRDSALVCVSGDCQGRRPAHEPHQRGKYDEEQAQQQEDVDKSIAQRDVEYFNELLSKETDENRRTILLRLLADAKERLRQAEEQEEKGANTEGYI